MIAGEPLPTAEGDLPYEFLNQVSLACTRVDLLERAYIGWLAPWPDAGSPDRPQTRLTLLLEHSREPAVKRFPWRPFTGDLVFQDGGALRVVPDLNVIHAHGADLAPEISHRWLRVF